MTDIERELYAEKEKIDRLTAPADLEARLRSALQDPVDSYRAGSYGHRRRRLRLLIAAAATLVLVLIYSYDSLAYYGRMVLGYETVVTGNIGALAEQGAGQEIARSHRFSDGTQVVLDAIMFDETELVAFYKVSRPNIGSEHDTLLLEIDGIRPMPYMAASGTGQLLDDDTMIWAQSFEVPAFYEKWLTLNMTLIRGGKAETGAIPFALDRGKAIKRMIRQPIDTDIAVDGFRIHFASVTASRLNTVIDGTIEPPAGAMDGGKYRDADPMNPFSLEYDIYIDGELYSTGYAGASPFNPSGFSSASMGLPAAFGTLEINDIRLVRMVLTDRSVPISAQARNVKIADDLILEEVVQEETAHGSSVITLKIASCGIPILGLFDGDRQLLADMESYAKLPESSTPVSRAYRFHGTSKDLRLVVKAVNYSRFAASGIPIVLE